MTRDRRWDHWASPWRLYTGYKSYGYDVCTQFKNRKIDW